MSWAQRVRSTPQQCYREAYFAVRLWRAYEEGQPWARTNLNGLEMAMLPPDIHCNITAQYAKVCGTPAQLAPSHQPLCSLHSGGNW